MYYWPFDGYMTHFNEIDEATKNVVREEMVDWFKKLPWWRRLFNKFEV